MCSHSGRQSIYALCAALLFLFTGSQAQAVKTLHEPLPGSQVAIAYQLPGSSKVYGSNYDIYMHPASTQKLLTALASMLYLGPDYTIKTRLQVQQHALAQDGRLITDSNGTLHSDVIVKFSADPTFRTDNYRALLGELSKRGVKNIQGNVILDISRIGTPDRANGWSYSDTPSCFSAPATAIILNKNCTFFRLYTPAVGMVAEPDVAAGLPIEVKSDAITVRNKDYGGDCELEAALYLDNKYYMSGCVPYDAKTKSFPLSVSVADPLRWGLDWTHKILAGHHITVEGQVTFTRTVPHDAVDLAVKNSQPLSKLVNYMLLHSNNLYADAIAKNTAAEYYAMPATYNRTARAIRAILSRYADISLQNAYLVDGSGLSPHNLLTARELLDVLSYIRQHDKELHLIELLPVSGKSGTLKWRSSTYENPLKYNVIAKTGTLQNVSNLAGFVRSKSGALLPFVIFTNGITYTERTRDAVKYRRVASPHLGYERYILEQIYAEKPM